MTALPDNALALQMSEFALPEQPCTLPLHGTVSAPAKDMLRGRQGADINLSGFRRAPGANLVAKISAGSFNHLCLPSSLRISIFISRIAFFMVSNSTQASTPSAAPKRRNRTCAGGLAVGAEVNLPTPSREGGEASALASFGTATAPKPGSAAPAGGGPRLAELMPLKLTGPAPVWFAILASSAGLPPKSCCIIGIAKAVTTLLLDEDPDALPSALGSGNAFK